ncbi:MAG: hypothetical protein ACFFG0_24530 [Candidatus Thorarchaeota archaeon]
MENKYRYMIFVFLLLLSLLTIWYSSGLNEVLDGKIYLIEISIQAKNITGGKIEPLYLQPFVFYYDFTEQKGNITLEPNRKLIYEVIDIRFPSVVKNDTLKVYSNIKGKVSQITNWRLDESYGFYEGNQSRILLTDLNEKFADEDTISIIFESNIVPKARFNFIIRENNVLYDDDGNINFVLGDDYQCGSPCIYGLNNVKERFNSFDNDIRIEWQVDKNNPNNSFYINAFSRTTLFKKNLFLSLGIALLVSLLVGILPFPKRRENKIKIKNLTKNEKYYCRICRKNHKFNSKIGSRHLENKKIIQPNNHYDKTKETIAFSTTISIFLATAISFLIDEGLGSSLPKVLQHYYAMTIPIYIILYGTVILFENIFSNKEGEKLLKYTSLFLVINILLMSVLLSGLIAPKFLVEFNLFFYWIVIPIWINVSIPLIFLFKYTLYVGKNTFLKLNK